MCSIQKEDGFSMFQCCYIFSTTDQSMLRWCLYIMFLVYSYRPFDILYEMGRWANVRHSPLQSRHSWYLLPFTFIWGSQHWKIYLWSIALSATKISNQPNLTQPNPTESNINLPMLGAKDSQSLQCFYLFARGQKGNGLVLWVEKFRRPTTAPQRIRSIVSAQKLKGILLVLLTYFCTIDVKYICISTYVFFQTFVLILRLK